MSAQDVSEGDQKLNFSDIEAQTINDNVNDGLEEMPSLTLEDDSNDENELSNHRSPLDLDHTRAVTPNQSKDEDQVNKGIRSEDEHDLERGQETSLREQNENTDSHLSQGAANNATVQDPEGGSLLAQQVDIDEDTKSHYGHIRDLDDDIEKKILREEDIKMTLESSASDEHHGTIQENENDVEAILEDDGKTLPKHLCCPTLGTQLQQPVVANDGITYDQDSISKPDSKQDQPSGVYFNRALFRVLQEYPTLRQGAHESVSRRLKVSTNTINDNQNENGESVKTYLCSLNDDMKQGGVEEGDKASIEKDDDDEEEEEANIVEDRILSDAYYCPITFDLMQEPTIDPEGNTYERLAIENWIATHGSSPITRTEMRVDDLYPNHTLLESLKYEIERYIRIIDSQTKKKHGSTKSTTNDGGKSLIHPSIVAWKKTRDDPTLLYREIPKLTEETGGTHSLTSAATTVDSTVLPYMTVDERLLEVELARRQKQRGYLCIFVALAIVILLFLFRLTKLVPFAIIYFVLILIACGPSRRGSSATSSSSAGLR